MGSGNFRFSVLQGHSSYVADTLHSVSTRVGACRTLLTDLTTSLAATTTVSRIHRVHVGAGNFQFSVQQGLSSAAVNFFKIWEYSNGRDLQHSANATSCSLVQSTARPGTDKGTSAFVWVGKTAIKLHAQC